MKKYSVEVYKGDQVLSTLEVRAHGKDGAEQQAGKIAHAQGHTGHSVRATHADGVALPAEPEHKQKEKFKRPAAPEPEAAKPAAEAPKPQVTAEKPKVVAEKAQKAAKKAAPAPEKNPRKKK